MFSGVGMSYICSQRHNYWIESSEPRMLGPDNSAAPLGEIS